MMSALSPLHTDWYFLANSINRDRTGGCRRSALWTLDSPQPPSDCNSFLKAHSVFLLFFFNLQCIYKMKASLKRKFFFLTGEKKTKQVVDLVQVNIDFGKFHLQDSP